MHCLFGGNKKDTSLKYRKMINNKIFSLLCEIGVCKEDRIEVVYPGVRESNDISVLRCQESGVIFLSQSEGIGIQHFQEKTQYCEFRGKTRREAKLAGYEDCVKRSKSIESIVINKKYLDFGTGTANILEFLTPFAKETFGVEPQKDIRDEAIKEGHNVFADIEDVPADDLEVVTLFHVLEHLDDPIGILKKIRDKMGDGGQIVIEVPHANDFLLSFLDLESFKKFTFRSDHLILHTRESLHKFLKIAGFRDIVIKGHQRFPLANHLYWLKHGKHGGHKEWSFLRSVQLDEAYSDLLKGIDKTDTLIAFAMK